MGAAAYNRGSRAISREADERMPAALARSERMALKDEIARLRAQLSTSQRDLARARRCLASERRGRDSLAARLREANSNYEFAVGTLCRIAFPGDKMSKPKQRPYSELPAEVLKRNIEIAKEIVAAWEQIPERLAEAERAMKAELGGYENYLKAMTFLERQGGTMWYVAEGE